MQLLKSQMILFACVLLSFAIQVNAQKKAPEVVLQSNYGGEKQEEISGVWPTADEGFLFGGHTNSKGKGGMDMWIVKADKNGKVQWDKTHGGEQDDVINDMIEATDGGFLMVGHTSSQGAGGKDFWLVKVNEKGEVAWEKTYGEANSDVAQAVVATKDGGYLVAGSHHSSEKQEKGKYINFNFEHYIWLIKTDKTGTEEWRQAIKCEDMVSVSDIITTKDGGFALLANTRFNEAKYEDMWLIKMNEKGEKKWDTVIKGETVDVGQALVQHNDGSYVIAGTTYIGDFTNSDAWLVKVSEKGKQQWAKTYGGKSTDQAYTLFSTRDGYIIGGLNASGTAESGSMWLFKVDKKGDMQWETTFGKDYFEQVTAIYPTKDGRYVVGAFAPTRYRTETHSTEAEGAIYGDMRLVILK